MAKKEKVYPTFISIFKEDRPQDIICLRLESFDSKCALYYRDGGQWDATVKIIKGKLKGEIVVTESKFEAIECTYDVWRKNNGHYGSLVTEDYKCKGDDIDDNNNNGNDIPF